MAKSYKVTVIAGTKVVADMAKNVLDATIEASLQVKTVAGGASSATPTILAPGPVGQNRKMEDVVGWFVNGTGNPLVAVGEPWEAPTGFKNTNWWDGTAGAWSLGSSVPLPTKPTSDVIVKDGTAATSQGGVYAFVDGKTIALTHGKNFYNPANRKKDQLISNTGNVGTSTGWYWSGLIDISMLPVGSWIYRETDGNRKGAAFFPKEAGDQELPSGGRYFDSPINGAFQKQEGDHFIGFNELSPTENTFTKAMVTVGTTAQPWEPYVKMVPKGSVEGLSDAITDSQQAKTVSSENKKNLESFEFEKKTSNNYLNPASKVDDSLLNLTTGAFITSPSYNGLDKTPCEQNTTYVARKSNNTAFNIRQLVFLNASGGVISSINTNTTSFTTPTGCVEYKAAVAKTEGTDFSQLGIMKSGNAFEPFKEVMAAKVVDDTPTIKKEGAEICTIDDAKNIAGSSQSKGDFNWSVDASGNMVLDYGTGSIAGDTANNRGYSGNNMFNFKSSVINNIAVGSGDDVAPQHILSTTIGANHGTSYQIATISNHGFGNTIIGTEWEKDGIKYYPIRIINANQIAFIPEYTGNESNFTFKAPLTVGAITYNGNSYNITAITSGAAQQLYPSIGLTRIETFADGSKVSLGKSGVANMFDVVEEYDIYNPANVVDRIKARAGQTQDPDFTGNSICKVRNTYSFKGNYSCVLTAEVFYNQVVTFQNIMSNQAVKLSGTPSFYVPNSKPIGSVDLTKPNALTFGTGVPSIYIKTNNNDLENPPARIVQYSGDVAFTFGYYPGFNDLSKTVNLFEIRGDSGKTYSHTSEAPPLPANTSVGDYHVAKMYRSYAVLSKVRKGNRLSYFLVHGEDETIIFIDYSGAVLDNILIDDCPRLNGKKIEVINSRNVTLISKTFNQGLIINATYVEGETSFIELRVK